MEELLDLLRDGHARTIELLAMELKTSPEDIERKIEYLEQIGSIKRVNTQVRKCNGCSGCSGGEQSGTTPCKGCMPEDGFKNMGTMWEVMV